MTRFRLDATPALLLLAGCLTGGIAAAQDTNLQDLQRRLDAAKRQKAASAAAAAAASSAAAERRAASPAILVVRSDAPCQLGVDDRILATLAADTPRTFQLPKGNVLVECQAAERDARYAATIALEPGVRRVVQIELRERVLAAQRRRETTGAPASPPAADATAAWPRIRSLLEARRGRQSLREGLVTLLDVTEPAEVDTVARFESLLRRMPYSSSFAMGARDGHVVYGVVFRRANAPTAADAALDSCKRQGGGCVVVMTNGSVQDGAIESVSRQLGGRPPAIVREAALRAFRQTVSAGY